MTWVVDFSSRSRQQLIALDEYIAQAASPEIAERFVAAIADFCLSLTVFPERGTCRDDIRPGLRITNFRKRTVIAFAVNREAERVTILAIFHDGQNYETGLDE